MRLLFIILLIVPSILSADGYKKFFPNDDDFYACKFLTTFETRDAAFKRELEGPKFVERDLDQVFNSGYKEVFSDVGRTFILNNEFFRQTFKVSCQSRSPQRRTTTCNVHSYRPLNGKRNQPYLFGSST